MAADYLRQELGEDGAVALVDIGARGTLFDRIATIFGDAGRFHGYLCYATPDALHRIAQGLRILTYMPLTADQFERARIIYRSPQFLEVLLNGEAETTIGYRRLDDDRVVPVTEPSTVADWQRSALRACHAGIQKYAELCENLGIEREPTIDPAAVLGILFRAIHLPTAEKAERLGALVYDVNNATRIVQPLCDEKMRRRVTTLCEGIRPALWLNVALQTRPTDLPWPQGALTLEYPGHLEDMIDGARGDFGHQAICRQILDMAQADGASSLIVCAAGGHAGMGSAFIDLARRTGIELLGYADHLVPGLGEAFDGVPVLALDAVARHASRFVAVVSIGYGSAIIAALHDGMDGIATPLRCFWFDGSQFQVTVIADGAEDRGNRP